MSEMPLLRVRFEDTAGKPLLPPKEIRLPAELSPRTATLCVLDILGKTLKADVGKALVALGFK